MSSIASGHDLTGVSIVIPHYGDPEQTQSLVKLLLAQQTTRSIEIIVSDDASPVPFPQGEGFRVIRSNSNGGFGSAVNRGAQIATMPLLMILNSDLVVDTLFVDRYAAEGSLWMPNAICGVRLRGGSMASQLPRHFPRNRYYFAESLSALARWHHGATWRRLAGIYEESSSQCVVDWILGAAMLLPAAAFHRVNGFDERYHMYMEEVDLQFRLSKIGFRSVYLGNVEAEHPAYGSSSNENARKIGVLNSRKLYAAKWHGMPGLRSLQMTLSISEVLNFIVYIARRIVGRQVSPTYQLAQRLNAVWKAPESHQRIVQ